MREVWIAGAGITRIGRRGESLSDLMAEAAHAALRDAGLERPDAIVAAAMNPEEFVGVGIPILGIVENMSTHICSQCGHEEHIFGQGGAERMCKEYGIELLGALPLDIAIREQADSGKPTVVADPEGRAAEIYRAIGRRLAVKIAESARDMTSKFPNIGGPKNTCGAHRRCARSRTSG